MNGLHLSHFESDYSEFVEVDPTGRYGRYNEILGKGASKTVYRAFDEYDGIEVAWNQVKLYDFLQSPEDLERLYCEIHLLKTLKHRNIMKFYTSWVNTSKRNINFVTEMFTSGTLKQYRLKHKKVNIRAVKHWCRQILGGLLYLHSHDPPVIHRDLKCDNIFINGNQGEVKIGDLGLAAVLRKSQHAAHCVGTPEFMAPEVYEEEYNELVDIYSFGMCVLEMVTFEYPYSECTHPAQIYKKVVAGKKPDALYKVKDPEVRKFVEKCLTTASMRHSALELLNDDFLRVDDGDYDLRPLRPVNCGRQLDDIGPLVMHPFYETHQNNSSFSNGYSNGYGFGSQKEWEYQPFEVESSGIELFEHHDEEEHGEDVNISIRGKRKEEDDSVVLRLRIADKQGHIRKIYFPFDIEMDTALSVATEMVAELDITDHDVTEIADMIDGEIARLVPGWQSGPRIVETPRFSIQNVCQNCVSNHTSSGSFMEFLSNNPGASQGCTHACTSMHGRFGEITYQEDESKYNLEGDIANDASQSDCLHYQEIWGQHESRELSSVGSGQSHSDEEDAKMNQIVTVMQDLKLGNVIASDARNSPGSHPFSSVPSIYCDLSDNSDHDIRKELRWLKAKHQIEFRELRDHQLGLVSKSSDKDHARGNGSLSCLDLNTMKGNNEDKCSTFTCLHSPNKGCPNSETQRVRKCEAILECSDAEEEDVGSAKSFYTNSQLLPHSLCRAVSLPVDAVDS